MSKAIIVLERHHMPGFFRIVKTPDAPSDELINDVINEDGVKSLEEFYMVEIKDREQEAKPGRCKPGRHGFIKGICMWPGCPVKEGEEPGLETIELRYIEVYGRRLLLMPGSAGYDAAKPLEV